MRGLVGGLNSSPMPTSAAAAPATSSSSFSSSTSAAAAAKAAGLGQFEPPWTKQDEEAVRAASASSCSTAPGSFFTPDENNTNKTSPSSSSAAPSSSSSSPSSSPSPPILLAMSEEELRRLAAADGEGAYRGKQAYDSITKGAATLDEIRGIPRSWRDRLRARGAVVGRAQVHSTALSSDGTLKLLLKLSDGHVVETVGIPSRDGARLTVCVSSQVGCPMRCSFCATGKGGYARNLTTAEIVGQVIAVRSAFEERAKKRNQQQEAAAAAAASSSSNDTRNQKQRKPPSPAIPSRVSNVVFMGMGEPALNLRAVLPALREINARLGVGARKITLSTVGVPNTIATRVAAENLQFTLAVSLHAPTQELRERLVPSAKAYPLDALLRDCVAYEDSSSGGGRRVTFEYALLSGVNDSQAHAAQLARLLKRYDLRSHVNLIPFNPISGDDAGDGASSSSTSPFAAPPRAVAAAFEATLTAAGIPASVRASRGRDASAACGQLRNEHQKRGAALLEVAAAAPVAFV